MLYFVGAGPGAPDLLTLRGQALLGQAQVVIYAGSLVNPALLDFTRPGCRIYNSAEMTLDEVIQVIAAAHSAPGTTGADTDSSPLGNAGDLAISRPDPVTVVRLHTGDPSLYGAIREQMDRLTALGIPYQVCPGVSSFSAAAAALPAEYTLPGISQSVIITRMAGKTPVPEREGIAALAGHGATMVIFLSAGLVPALAQELKAGGYAGNTPAAIIYKATWPEELVLRGTVDTLEELASGHGITHTALILVGDFLGEEYQLSRLYAPDFATAFRPAKPGGDVEA